MSPAGRRSLGAKLPDIGTPLSCWTTRSRGQIRPDLAPDLVIELLYGPAYYHWLIRQRPADADHIHMIVDVALAGLAPANTRPDAPPAGNSRPHPQ
ncbi:TetR-like C-terminal domain-containing protein [Streptosporangium canum]|uniref:TetR-like C-terminal domain-containing protein n=1 Tax=Streptosporangium canum TaxID=324952 RepID=UPI000AA43ED7|nr:TetR-like C-terminal domain-containing protein [Streptosporangium canum]